MKATQLLSYKAESDTGNPGRISVGLTGTRPQIWSVHTGTDSRESSGQTDIGNFGLQYTDHQIPNTGIPIGLFYPEGCWLGEDFG